MATPLATAARRQLCEIVTTHRVARIVTSTTNATERGVSPLPEKNLAPTSTAVDACRKFLQPVSVGPKPVFNNLVKITSVKFFPQSLPPSLTMATPSALFERYTHKGMGVVSNTSYPGDRPPFDASPLALLHPRWRTERVVSPRLSARRTRGTIGRFHGTFDRTVTSDGGPQTGNHALLLEYSFVLYNCTPP